jgi:3D (Asp-Asp-Asp) domain-containing protein
VAARAPVTGGYSATAYGPPWGGIQGTGTTATGIDLHASPKRYLVAVDPTRIPLGSKLRIWPNPFGDRNIIFTAADTGGAIKGNRIDFYDWRGRAAQLGWGTRNVRVAIVGKGDPKDAAGPSTGDTSPAAARAGGDASPGPGGGGITDAMRSSAMRALLYVALIVGATIFAGYGAYRLAGQGAKVAV